MRFVVLFYGCCEERVNDACTWDSSRDDLLICYGGRGGGLSLLWLLLLLLLFLRLFFLSFF